MLFCFHYGKAAAAAPSLNSLCPLPGLRGKHDQRLTRRDPVTLLDGNVMLQLELVHGFQDGEPVSLRRCVMGFHACRAVVKSR